MFVWLLGGSPTSIRFEAAGQPHRLGKWHALCAFLCPAQAGYITGQNLLIDGRVFNGAF